MKTKALSLSLSLSRERGKKKRGGERERERVDFVRTASRAICIYLISPFPRVFARASFSRVFLLRFLLVFFLFATFEKERNSKN
jgi:hypothetical protein